ncbi:heme transporter IsdDEF, lipoprotein IsdE [Lachnospiraceae bacterium KM106-2]|nr:heme transporter IsdDEF, lipoprotein IsdE [Lachnospiraceae bacterium KM106-2]
MNKVKILLSVSLLALLLQGCAVNKKPEDTNKEPTKKEETKNRIAVTSVATLEILDALGVDDVVGIPKTASDLPERYKDLTEIGTPMAPDLETLKTVNPTVVISPVSLQGDLKEKYENAGIKYYFIDLDSVEGMYDSIKELGEMFDKTKEADKLCKEHTIWLETKTKGKTEDAKSVLILMGLPGSYVVATENSYVGNLVSLAGGKNCYEGESKEDFINVNTEDMLKKNPDIIIRTAHALPEQVNTMFQKEFSENDIWKHFQAVKNKMVFDTQSHAFGMSANLSYKEAVEEIEGYLSQDAKN